MSAFIGWGYEGKTLEDLLTFAAEHNVGAVVDVRLTPISRKKGFSKSRLRETLESAGIEYIHTRELGNPKDNRAPFAHPGTEAAERAHERFTTEVLQTNEGSVAIHELCNLAQDVNVIVLCYEADHATCHRSLVIDAAERLARTRNG